MDLTNPMGLISSDPEISSCLPANFINSKVVNEKLNWKQKELLEVVQMVHGPLAMLTSSIHDKDTVRVYCRHNTVLLGRLAAFDKHLNLIMKDVTECFEIEPKGIQSKACISLDLRDWKMVRFMRQMLVRGDNVILIGRDPTGSWQA